MYNKKLNAFVSVISTSRPNNVGLIQQQVGKEVTFYVSKGEGKFYEKCGALAVVECERNISAARNAAMNDATKAGVVGIQISDDLKRIYIASMDSKKVKSKKQISFYTAAGIIIAEMKLSGAKLAGVAVTSNLFYYAGKEWSFDKLIVNDLIFTDGNAIQFDEAAALKEDYDMFVQQRLAGNIVLRANHVLVEMPHRNNFGGANTYRTGEEERSRNRYVMAKHPQIIVEHKKRTDQIEINYKALAEAMKK